MFSAVSRSVARSAVTQPVRCMAKKSSKLPGSNKPPSPPPPPSQSEAPIETEAQEIKELEQPVLTRSNVPSLDFSPPDPTEERQKTGASPRDSVSSADRKRSKWGRGALGVFALGVGLNVAYMGREWEPEELQQSKMVCNYVIQVNTD